MAADARRARGWVVGGLLMGSGVFVGCSSMDAIDRRIERVLGDTSGRMGTLAPEVRASAEGRAPRSVYEETPGTTNPSADELEFDPADPDRDVQQVLERLESFYDDPNAQPREVDLEESFRTAQRTGREYISAEEDYIFSVIRLLIERHLWGPRFFNDVRTEIDVDSISGDYDAELRVINELRVTQRLPYGGDVEAALVSGLAQELLNASSNEYTESTQLVLSANLPLLRGAGEIAREDRIQAERDTVYAARSFERFRREFLVDIARDYFNLIALRDNINNQERRLGSVNRLLAQRIALVNAGRRASFDARNVEQNVARSRASLSSSKETFRLALDRFKVRLGLDVDDEIQLADINLRIPEPFVSVDQAARWALTFRLDYQNTLDRLEDRRRGVENAKNLLLPDLDVAASAAFGTDPDPDESLAPDFDLEDTSYDLSVTFGLPLDREIERLNLRRAQIDLSRGRRDLDRIRDNIIVDARAAVREIERARFALELQEEAIEINQLRIEELEIKEAETDAQQQLDAQDELLQSQNDRDVALRDLRVAILNYLLVTGQMRVADDGTFEALRGMGGVVAPPPGPPPAEGDPADPIEVPEGSDIPEDP